MAARKKIIVKPEYQLKLALTFFIYIVIYSAILGFIIFYPLYSALNSAASIDEQARISSMVLFLHKRVWIGFFLVAVLAAVHAIFSSHRVVGPMYRFERMIEELTSGNYAHRIRIRKRDEFKEMEGLLNALAQELELRRNRDAAFCNDVKTRLEMISAMLEAEGAEYPEDVKHLTQGLISELNARCADG
ncbi:MAG: HAMP domain-containing protein [Thermodesulfobacteriota bacterium]